MAILAMTSACSSSGSGSGNAAIDPSAARRVPTTRVIPVSLAMSPATGSTDVRLDAPITISATDGRLLEVVVTNAADGTPLAGALADGGLSWTSTGPLAPGATYGVKVTGQGNGGTPTHQEWTFSTLNPTDDLHTTVNVGAGRTYGVGVPIIVQLNHPVAPTRGPRSPSG